MLRNVVCRLFAGTLVLLALAPAEGAACEEGELLEIAVTIDDVPWVGGLGKGDSRQKATERILAALKKHSAPATAFVVCNRMKDDDPRLRAWLDAGMSLANHSNSHPKIDDLELDEWRKDVETCTGRLGKFLGTTPKWFRFPCLQSGKTLEKRAAALKILKDLGHSVAPVSVDTGEYVLVKPYVKALSAGDKPRAAKIGQAYVAHVMAAVRHYREVSRERLGRQIRHILLLHANALAADYLDQLLTELEKEGFSFITFDYAMADPAYALEDDYAGPIGLSWLYRFKPHVTGSWEWDARELERLKKQEYLSTPRASEGPAPLGNGKEKK